jgi:hypothetical protein
LGRDGPRQGHRHARPSSGEARNLPRDRRQA